MEEKLTIFKNRKRFGIEKNIDKVKIIDCSWHMPQTQRNGFDEYNEEHIPNAIFFDILFKT